MHGVLVRGMAIAGLALLLLAAILDWFTVPIDFEVTRAGITRCIHARPWVALPYRLACLVAAALIARGYLTGRRRPGRVVVASASLLGALAYFPSLVMTYDPPVAAQASWLHMQHENLVWAGGDLASNQEYARLSWRDRVYVTDNPRQVSIFKMPFQGSAAWQLGQLQGLTEALGYSNQFCQFVRPGWFAAMAGACFVLLAECIAGGRLHPDRAVLALRAASAAALAGLVVAAVPLTAAIRTLALSRESAVRGDYAAAEVLLRRAARILPALGEDTYYLAQLGLLHWRLDRRDSPPGRFFRANLLERAGRDAQALEIYRDLLSAVPRGGVVHREACRAVLRAGINALNAGRTDHAIALLQAVLAREPCNIKANFTLQLAYLRTSQRGIWSGWWNGWRRPMAASGSRPGGLSSPSPTRTWSSPHSRRGISRRRSSGRTRPRPLERSPVPQAKRHVISPILRRIG